MGSLQGQFIKKPLQVSLFGTVRIEWQDQEILKGKRKPVAVLAYLATVPDNRARRETLAELFWGDQGEQKARNSLRQCLSILRRSIPKTETSVLDIDKDTIGLNPDAFETDIGRILNEIENGVLSTGLEGRADMASAFLANMSGFSPAADEWSRSVAHTVETKLVSRLFKIIRDAQSAKELKLRACKLVTLIEPMNEEASRFTTETLGDLGEVGAAIKEYERLYNLLDEELGMEPSAATQDLIVAIKNGEHQSVPATWRSEESPQIQPFPLQSASIRLIPRVAILPFKDLGPDLTPSYFAEGILEDIVSQLVRLDQLQVYSSNSTRSFQNYVIKDNLGDFNLDAEYFVMGNLRSKNSSYRITVQLVDARNGLTEWAQTYTAGFEDLFEMQADIASNIAHQIAPVVDAAELNRIVGSEPSSLTSYHLTLQAREQAFSLDANTFEDARAALELAKSKDPNFTLTSLVTADLYSLAIGQGWNTQGYEAAKELEAATQNALRISHQSGRALSMHAHCQNVMFGFLDSAAELCREAVQHAPNDAEALLWSVPTLAFIGEHAQAVQSAHHAIALSPHDPFMFRYQHFLSIAQFANGDFSAAADSGKRSHRLNPNYTSNLRMTAACLAEIGEMDAARQLAQQCIKLDPKFSVDALRKRQPFKCGDISERYVSRLYEVGLPK